MAVAEGTAVTRVRRGSARWLVVFLPYAWLFVFFLVPFMIVIKIALSQTAVAQPPYEPVFDLSAGVPAGGFAACFKSLAHSGTTAG